MSPSRLLARAIRLRPLFCLAGLLLLVCSGSLRAANGISWDSTTFPLTGYTGTNIQFTYSVTNTSNPGEPSWDATCRIELRTATGTDSLYSPSVSGTVPGGPVTVTFNLTLPATAGSYNYRFVAMQQGAEFGAIMRGITVTVAPPTPPPSPPGVVTLSTYGFPSVQLPIINTTWNPMPPVPVYRLRAKFPIVGSYMGWGFHAATTFNNKGLPLDALPPAGAYYPLSLYWLRYDDTGSTLLEIGPETLHSAVIVEPSVLLSSYWFNKTVRPIVTSNQPLPNNYKLTIQIVGALAGAGIGVSWNNDTRFLDQLPPPGTYQVQLFWQKYNVTGTAVLETGGFHTETITIVDGPNRIFTGGGDITYDDSTDEDGNNIGTGYSSDLFDIYVPVPGQLHLSSSSRFWYVLADPAWSAVATGGDASPLDIVLSVQPGVYHLWCVGTSPGAYSLSADILPYTPLPVITNTVLPSAILGVPYSVTVTADIAVNARFAGGLPLGLACNPVTGVISGTPTQAGDFNVLLWATNSAGYHGPSKKLTLSVARGNQSITFAPLPDRSNLDSVFSLTATASSGLDVTYLVVSGPATVTGRVVTLDGPAGIVTIRAMQVGNVSYNAAVPVNRSFTVSFAAPTVITHPAPQSVIAGASAMFSVTATGSAPLAYQWWKGSTALSNTGAASGATTAALTLTNVAVSDAGNYNGLASKMWTLS